MDQLSNFNNETKLRICGLFYLDTNDKLATLLVEDHEVSEKHWVGDAGMQNVNWTIFKMTGKPFFSLSLVYFFKVRKRVSTFQQSDSVMLFRIKNAVVQILKSKHSPIRLTLTFHKITIQQQHVSTTNNN